MKHIKFLTTIYDNGYPKFKQGEVRPHTPEMDRWIRRGAAVEVEVKPADNVEHRDEASGKKGRSRFV